MLRELPLYDIVIDLDDPETTVSFNSLVANPAHEKSFETFSQKIAYQFNDEEQVITGVAISANTPIFRSCLLYTSPSPRDGLLSRMPSSA